MRLLEDAARDGLPLRGVVHAWNLPDRETHRTNGHAAEVDVFGRASAWLGSVLHLVQALAASKAAPPRLWLVTQGGQAVADDEKHLDVSQSAVWGLARVIAQEHPELKCARLGP